MKYSYEFKLKCADMYNQGLYMEPPDGVKATTFHRLIRVWVRTIEACGTDTLKHNNFNKDWSAEKRYELVARAIAGESISSVVVSVGINSGQLYQWVRKYKIWGYNGLIIHKKGRPPKNSDMKKLNYNNPRKLEESEYEELIRLRAKNEYIKAEIEVIKKKSP